MLGRDRALIPIVREELVELVKAVVVRSLWMNRR